VTTTPLLFMFAIFFSVANRQLQSLTDEELYRMYGKGNAAAFRVLMDRYSGMVFGYLARFLGNSELARDVSQEAFIRVIKSADSFRGDSSFRTFLFVLVRHAALDAVKGQRVTVADDELENLATPDRSDLKLLSNQLSSAMEKGLAKLPPEQREAFLLREIDGMTFPEIAEIQQVNKETARSRVYYALKSLRQSLKGFGGNHE
jgi:RNA polymerase sigma-70 factor (ECF subfamily)